MNERDHEVNALEENSHLKARERKELKARLRKALRYDPDLTVRQLAKRVGASDCKIKQLLKEAP